MPTQCVTGTLRFNIDDPDDFAALVDSGLIWNGTPHMVAKAIRAILDGVVPRPTHNIPPQVLGYLRLQDRIERGQ